MCYSGIANEKAVKETEKLKLEGFRRASHPAVKLEDKVTGETQESEGFKEQATAGSAAREPREI